MSATPPVSLNDLDEAASVFDAVRPRLFGIAYRMLGSIVDAEDIVQEAWIRWQTYDRATVQNPPAFLATTATRLAINAAGSARVRRETYIGPWLPEPVDTSADPSLGAERGEALAFAVLLLLEKLTPTERAAYILREAFDYPYGEIASMLHVTEAACRQLVSRARKHLAAERRSAASADEQQRLLQAFLAAAQAGDLAALEAVLAADAVSTTDGGGITGAARIPVSGRERVARFVASFASHFWNGIAFRPVQANGEPAVLLVKDNAPHALLTIDVSAGGIRQLLWVMSPAKLARIAQASAPSSQASRVHAPPVTD